MNTTPQQTTWLQELWPRLTVASGIGYVATAYTVSHWLTRRSPAVVGLPEHLGRVHINRVECFARDDIVLKGWCIEPAAPHATIALFHGMRLNRTDMLERIAFLSQAGFRCIAFDHRAHGESGGRRTSFGYHERHDVEAIAGFIRDRWPNSPCAALGVSMGAAALCFADDAAEAFQAIVLESLYDDLHRAFQHRVGCGYPAWFQHFRRGILWFTERRLGLRVRDVAPIAHIAKLASRPVLLVTGSDDPHAPPHEVETLAGQLPHTSQLHVVPGATHNDVCTRGGLAYRDLILSFLGRHLSSARLAA